MAIEVDEVESVKEEAKEEVETVDLELEKISVDSWDEIVEVPIKVEEEATPTAIIKQEAEDSWDDDDPQQIPSPVPDLPDGHAWNVPTAQDLLDAAWQLHQRQGDRGWQRCFELSTSEISVNSKLIFQKLN